MAKKEKLNEKQKRFCREYLIDYNGTQAAIRAGYSAESARNQSSRMMTNDDIRDFIFELQDRRSRRLDVSADRVILELSRVAFSDPADFYDENGNLLSIPNIPEDARKSLSGLEVTEEYEGFGRERVPAGFTKKIKRWDKVKALELLGKHLKMFTEKHEHTGKDDGPIQIQAMEPYESGLRRIKQAIEKEKNPE